MTIDISKPDNAEMDSARKVYDTAAQVLQNAKDADNKALLTRALGFVGGFGLGMALHTGLVPLLVTGAAFTYATIRLNQSSKKMREAFEKATANLDVYEKSGLRPIRNLLNTTKPLGIDNVNPFSQFGKHRIRLAFAATASLMAPTFFPAIVAWLAAGDDEMRNMNLQKESEELMIGLRKTYPDITRKPSAPRV